MPQGKEKEIDISELVFPALSRETIERIDDNLKQIREKRMNYEDAKIAGKVEGGYTCAACNDGKVYKPQGFAVHMRHAHNIGPPGTTVKEKTNKAPEKKEQKLMKYCPNCGFPVGEVEQAINLLAAKR